MLIMLGPVIAMDRVLFGSEYPYLERHLAVRYPLTSASEKGT